MKINLMMNLMGGVLTGMIRPAVSQRPVLQKIRRNYRQILLEAGEIGGENKLLSSYLLAAYFIAMNRCTGLTPEENLSILRDGMETSRLLKLFLGSPKHYFSEKNMESRRAWAKQTQARTYPNDWVVEVVEQGEDYAFGLNYHECGVCKLCRDQGCPELAKYLCSLDFMLVELMGIGLKRTGTLAEGASYCDFRFIRP